jgi:oligopeptide transport system ATP-binding protein
MKPGQRTFDSFPGFDPQAPLLDVHDLRVEFVTHQGIFQAVNGVDYTLSPGETLGILGESGSGKSVSQEAVIGIVKSPPGRVSGSVLFRGTELVDAPADVRQEVRGQGIAMIFQDAITALNPGLTVGYQIAEMYRVRNRVSAAVGRAKAIELMDRVKIPSAHKRVNQYPHEFSGGMCQRVMIAMALTQNPAILIADEPTTALDVTVQRQILELLGELQMETRMGLVLITHDLGVVAEAADRIAVMYAGRIVETAPSNEIFDDTSHPYTRALMASVPRMEGDRVRLRPVSGSPPVLSKIPRGCAFHPRCAMARDACRADLPPLVHVSENHATACLFYEEVRMESCHGS